MDNRKESAGFLIDGFPRNQNNLDGWEKEMKNKVKVHFVLYLSAPLDICVERCLSRSQGRSDDNKVKKIINIFIQKRFRNLSKNV